MDIESTPATVLIVDDDDLDRFLVGLVLDAAGYRVLEAPSAEAALDMMRTEACPDAMVVDYVMTGMDGIEFCERVRARPALRDVPIVVRTGLEVQKVDALVRAAGADRLLAKSGDPSPLLDALAQTLGARGAAS